MTLEFLFVFKIVNTQDTDTNSHRKPILGYQLQINIFNEIYIYMKSQLRNPFNPHLTIVVNKYSKPFLQFSTSSNLLLAMT